MRQKQREDVNSQQPTALKTILDFADSMLGHYVNLKSKQIQSEQQTAAMEMPMRSYELQAMRPLGIPRQRQHALEFFNLEPADGPYIGAETDSDSD